MKAIAKPICMKKFPNKHFRLCVLALYHAHVIAPRLLIMHVCHAVKLSCIKFQEYKCATQPKLNNSTTDRIIIEQIFSMYPVSRSVFTKLRRDDLPLTQPLPSINPFQFRLNLFYCREGSFHSSRNFF